MYISPLMRRLVIAPLVFFIIINIISFFVRILEIDEKLYYIMVVMISVPVGLYIIIGGWWRRMYEI